MLTFTNYNESMHGIQIPITKLNKNYFKAKYSSNFRSP